MNMFTILNHQCLFLFDGSKRPLQVLLVYRVVGLLQVAQYYVRRNFGKT